MRRFVFLALLILLLAVEAAAEVERVGERRVVQIEGRKLRPSKWKNFRSVEPVSDTTGTSDTGPLSSAASAASWSNTNLTATSASGASAEPASNSVPNPVAFLISTFGDALPYSTRIFRTDLVAWVVGGVLVTAGGFAML